jgi:2-methylisocitrate lyase-like PEP mutase family enzyme
MRHYRDHRQNPQAAEGRSDFRQVTGNLDLHVGIPLALFTEFSHPLDMHIDEVRGRFRTLHESGTFLMPNPFDLGSCRLLDSLGFPALATTSGGFAMSMGRMDMTVDREELIEHVASLRGVTDLPINVDAERCFPERNGGVAATVQLLAGAGACGCSIEDWDPVNGVIEDLDVVVERVGAAAAAADDEGMVLTARAENHLRGHEDLDDTIARLSAYQRAGAHVLYAPGLIDLTAIARIVDEVGGPVNVLMMPGGPSRDQLSEVGVRRLSVGGTLARAAYGALYELAQSLIETGSLPPDAVYLSRDMAQTAFTSQS